MPLGRLADRQRPNPPRIAAGFHAVRKQKQQTESPLQMFQHVRHRIMLLHVRRLGQQMNDDLCISRRLENMPVLRIAQFGRAGRGISHVANGRMPGQFLAQHPRIEYLRNQAHPRMAVECAIGRDGDPGRFLTAMLECKQPLVANLR